MTLAASMRNLMTLKLAVACWLFAPVSGFAQPLTEPVIVSARIGFNGVYKLGCWTPLEIELLGQATAYTGVVTVTVPDSDGVPTTVVSPRPVGIEPGQSTKFRLFVRVGQANSGLNIRFSADGKIRAQKYFYLGSDYGAGVIPGGLTATDRVVLQFGPSIGWGDLVEKQDDSEPTTRVARIEVASELPTQWYGYESIDTVLLTSSQPELYRPLLQNPLRLAALRNWVFQGGRLIVFCGAHGEELLSPDGPLAGLIPGKYAETITLRQSQSLEVFCNADQPVTPDRRLDAAVPRLTEVNGKVLVDAGSSGLSLPLVVHSRLGLGDLIFVGLDFDRPPLLDWPSRASFLKKAIHWQNDEQQASTEQRYGYEIGTDLISQLRSALDEKFVGVEIVSFGLVTLLVVAYILLIGPADYFFVRKVLQRTELTWITFPLIVLGVSAAAYWFANWMKGDQLRVNQVEVVDVDTLSGKVRGTTWTHFFTPKVHEFNLSFKPRMLGSNAAPEAQSLVSWLGLPGNHLGGMQAGSEQSAMFNSGYSFSPALDAMHGVPVQVWSTKTITSRWSTNSSIDLESQLTLDGDELRGSFTNSSAIEFEDCQLLYGSQAYNVGRVAPGTVAKIDGSKLPRRVKTLLTNATAGDSTESETAEDGTVSFDYANKDIARLVKVMMFYRAIDGPHYTGMLDRYQSFLDLSHLLEQDNLAILLCRVSTPGSQWLDDAEAIGSDQDRHWTYYRFVVPVGEKLESNP